MSINQNLGERKSESTIPQEEEFEIVSSGKSASGDPKAWQKHAFIVGVVILIASVSFGIGKLISAGDDKAPITVVSDTADVSGATPAVLGTSTTATIHPAVTPVKKTTSPAPKTASKPPLSTLTSGPIVASKNGTKYYLTTCSGASRINDANKIYFASTDDARKAGLTPSSTCKGLQ